MNLSESFLTAVDSLMANKMRAILTMLGVIIGVAAVIALMAIGSGVSASVTSEIQSIGSNLLTISTDLENSGGLPSLSLDDVDALSDPLYAPDIAQVGASVAGQQEIVYAGGSASQSVNGVTANYFALTNLTDFTAGDGLTDNDIETSARVAVLGSNVVTELFGDEYPVGKSVKISGVSYEVVGVLAQQGLGLGNSPDETVYIPISTAQSRLYPTRTRSGDKAVNSILAQVVSEDQTDAAITQVTDILRQEHRIAYAGEDDFSIFSQTDLIAT
ncbi:MAG: ABC transporter permease, partial [Anaerolineae bacterium]|nr:ABC transporter permease [Anaerolineae bacterium]